MEGGGHSTAVAEVVGAKEGCNWRGQILFTLTRVSGVGRYHGLTYRRERSWRPPGGAKDT